MYNVCYKNNQTRNHFFLIKCITLYKGAGQIFNFILKATVLTAKVVSTVAFKIKLKCVLHPLK